MESIQADTARYKTRESRLQSPSRTGVRAVPSFTPKVEWNILVLDHVPTEVVSKQANRRILYHVLNLSPHCQNEENEEVHDENGPVNGNVEGF